jgi:localization factor PodJL
VAAARRAAQAAAAETVAPPAAAAATAEPSASLLSRLKGKLARPKAVEAPDLVLSKPAQSQPEMRAPEPQSVRMSLDDRPAKAEVDAGAGVMATHRRTILMGVGAALILIAASLSMIGGSDPAPTARPAAPAASSSPAAPAPEASRSRSDERPGPETSAPRRVDTVPVTPVPDSGPRAQALETPVTTGSVPPAARAPLPGTTVNPAGWQPVGRDGRPVQPTASLPRRLIEMAEGGDPGALIELGTRHLEGRGTPTNTAEAARLFQRAADAGSAPGLYRLGSLFEKGTGVTRDVARARGLYERAAAAGNSKAMHNLAVLMAQGFEGQRPDYRAAATWFRRAGELGIADSQYNLGILYARGLGVEQNLAESYKWFALAANGGDRDAVTKRDEVAGRLDNQTMVAARLAVQTFAVRTEPDGAGTHPAPQGGWGDTVAQAPRGQRNTASQR